MLRLSSWAIAAGLVLMVLINTEVIRVTTIDAHAKTIIAFVATVADTLSVELTALDQEAMRIFGRRASSLIALTDTQVLSRIGTPTLAQDQIWYFDTPMGTLRVYFSRGIVSEVHPSNFRLDDLSHAWRQTRAPRN
jgi:hypothetical protein